MHGPFFRSFLGGYERGVLDVRLGAVAAAVEFLLDLGAVQLVELALLYFPDQLGQATPELTSLNMNRQTNADRLGRASPVATVLLPSCLPMHNGRKTFKLAPSCSY